MQALMDAHRDRIMSHPALVQQGGSPLIEHGGLGGYGAGIGTQTIQQTLQNMGLGKPPQQPSPYTAGRMGLYGYSVPPASMTPQPTPASNLSTGPKLPGNLKPY